MIIKEAPEKLINSCLKYFPEIAEIEGAIVAGGFIRSYYAGEEISDMDIYFKTEKDFNNAGKSMDKYGWQLIGKTDRALTYTDGKNLVQLIGYVFGEPAEIVNAFDYTVCSAALIFKKEKQAGLGIDANDPFDLEVFAEIIEKAEYVTTGELCLHDDFFEHLAGRILVFTGSPLPLASLRRVRKYMKRGYHICDENLIALARAISEQIDFDNPESLEEHIADLSPDNEGRIRVID